MDSKTSRESEGSFVVYQDKKDSAPELKLPLRPAGRTISWRFRTQGKSKLQEQRKYLARDLRGMMHAMDNVKNALESAVAARYHCLQYKHPFDSFTPKSDQLQISLSVFH